MMEKVDRDEKMEKIVQVPIERHIPEDLPVLWSNHFVVQHTQHEFILTFFQVTPPILIKPTPKELEAIKSVPARAVSRIALTPRAMAELLDVIRENYESFEKKKLASEE